MMMMMMCFKRSVHLQLKLSERDALELKQLRDWTVFPWSLSCQKVQIIVSLWQITSVESGMLDRSDRWSYKPNMIWSCRPPQRAAENPEFWIESFAVNIQMQLLLFVCLEVWFVNSSVAEPFMISPLLIGGGAKGAELHSEGGCQWHTQLIIIHCCMSVRDMSDYSLNKWLRWYYYHHKRLTASFLDYFERILHTSPWQVSVTNPKPNTMTRTFISFKRMENRWNDDQQLSSTHVLLSLQCSVEWGKPCYVLIQCMCVWCHSPPVTLSQPLPFCPSSPGGQQTSVRDASIGRVRVNPKRYEPSQGWLRHSEAEARFSGTISSMGRRKCVKWPASSANQPYFSTSTSNRDHGLSLVMCLSSPLRLKNSREYFPERAKCRGIQPRSSMIWAIWSSSRE